MALNSTHPLFSEFVQDWIMLRDSYKGERQVKLKGDIYLPATPGQLLDGMKAGQLGKLNYDAYKTRALFHDYVNEAVQTYIGLLHQNPPTIELPDAMKDMLEHGTNNGESLETLLRRVNEQQLVSGRLGLLLDLPRIPDPAKPLPYITMYTAETVRNWDDSDDKEGVNTLEFVSLDESAYERNADFVWQLMEKYRILILGDVIEAIRGEADVPLDQRVEAEAEEESKPRVYKMGTFYVKDGNALDESKMIVPMIRGTSLDKVPFVFVNSKDIISQPDTPPLLGLCRLTMAIYRGEADYRHHLFMQGQDTLVVVGGLKSGNDPLAPDDDAQRVGAGARIDVDIGGDAKYIGVNSTGLSEVRQALENDKKRAESKAGTLDGKGSQKESGEALKIRMAAQTATLTSIALSGAAAIENLLKIAAEWLGQDPEKVKVTPNLEFSDFQVDGKEIVDLMSARTMGAPISLESIHSIMVERGLTQMSFEDEMAKVDEEDAGRAQANQKLGLDPTGAALPLPGDPTNPADPAHPNHPDNPANKGKKGAGAGNNVPASA